jgi:hypothetical protein
MSEKTLKLMKELEAIRARKEELKKEIAAGKERNMFLKKQIENKTN